MEATLRGVQMVWLSRVLCLASALALADVRTAHAARFNQTLDDGVTVVVVDNYSSRADAHIANLVVAADRSTQDDGMWYRARKGLFGQGHRVFVNDNYLAWFDNGVLQGVWTLDGATGTFRHNRTGPNGFYPWAHNDLLKGSASPQQQVFTWDLASPGIEHSIGFDVGGTIALATHNNAYFAANGNWHVIYDGTVINGDVYYATGGRLAGSIGTGPFVVDVSDGNDSNGIQNHIDSQLGFVCRLNDIKIIWRFAPAAGTVHPFHTYYWIWAHYSFDTDGTPCDYNAGNNSPDDVWGEPAYYQSSMYSTYGSTLTSPLSIVPLVRGVPCPSQTSDNEIRYSGQPAHGDWIRWGEDSVLSSFPPVCDGPAWS